MAQGADPHLRDTAGFNACWWAKEFKHQTVVDLFAEMQVEPKSITAGQLLAHAGVKLVTGSRARRKDRSARRKPPLGRDSRSSRSVPARQR
mmetsp:Transcript_32563/g.93384  ORF Transcript_32563/g.93384 Transcript_32563/m.93384 type:complete len:91 (+) Transcript_32563:3-275(+)